MVRLDKDQSGSNAAFEEIRQGDVVTYEIAELRAGYMKIKKETTLALLPNRLVK
jgi:hypothetical protein